MGSRRRMVQGAVILAVLLLTSSAIYWRQMTGEEQSGEPPATGASATAAAANPSSTEEPAAAAEPAVTAAEEAAPSADTPAPVGAWQEPRGASFVRESEEPAEEPTAEPSAASTATAVASAEPPDAGAPVVRAAAVVPPVSVDLPGTAVGFFRDGVGGSYRLVSVQCLLNGAVVYSGSARSATLFNRQLSPGQHTIAVAARYKGSGGGVFSYMEGYRYKVQVGRAFNVRSGETTTVTVNAFERGGVTASHEGRLAMSVSVK